MRNPMPITFTGESRLSDQGLLKVEHPQGLKHARCEDSLLICASVMKLKFGANPLLKTAWTGFEWWKTFHVTGNACLSNCTVASTDIRDSQPS